MVPFAEYAPDRIRFDPAVSDTISNVIPAQGGYRPFPSLAVYSDPLPGACRGGIMVRRTTGTYAVFAATASRIYRLDGDTWTDVSGPGAPYSLADGDTWSATQYGDLVIFANVNNVPQSYDIGVGSTFANLGGSPPSARYVGVSGDYLLLLSTAADPNRLYRSGVNNPNWWTPKARQADFQDLPDGGWITGMAGNDRGAIIFSQSTIRVLTDQPGSALLFTLAKTEASRGVAAPYSIVQVGALVFFLAEDGFYMSTAGEAKPIGAERVDRTFLNELLDISQIGAVQGASDPINKIVCWLYPNLSGGKSIIGYQWQLDKWFHASTAATFLLPATTAGYTMEQLESLLGYTNLDTLPASLDSRLWQGGRPSFAAFNATNQLAFYTGSNMEATLETADMALAGEGMRSFVRGFRPLIDSDGAYGTVARAETYGQNRTWGSEAAQTVTGMIPCRSSGRLHRFRVRVPSGTVWKEVTGLEVDAQAEGRR